ncbi:hypothetical protein IPA_05305 [Ignicoccus pacificus DSM 13166]|uniref:AAA+ ATPase domain-containing protein n=1 Tax=Ignicoccus pacificus DSM 13166 TaxID=940294 RepID=A0A977KB75_9CREN|nr:hypothetical protein IPA_05305 [Ignicoccus pacificus DSM 13166]
MELSPTDAVEVLLRFMRSYDQTKETPGVLLLGAPGIGKTEAVIKSAKLRAEELGLKFWIYESKRELPDSPDNLFTLVLLRLDMIKPEDLTGIPDLRSDSDTFDYKLPRWVKVLRDSAGGLLFLDEFTNVADDTLMSAAFEIILNKSVNMYRFDKMVVAAGNPPEYNALARPLPAPLLSGRLAVFEIRTPKLSEWLDYMHEKYGENWAPEVYAFLSQHPDFFIMPPEDPEGLEPFPTPRAWSKLAVELQTAWREEMDKVREDAPVSSSSQARVRRVGVVGRLISVTSAFVGSEAGTRFVAWLRVKPPSIDEIIKTPELIREINEEQKYMLATQLATMTSKPKWKDKALAAMQAFVKSNEARLAIMALRMMPKKKRDELLSYMKSKDKKLWNKLAVELKLAQIWRR